MSTSALKEAWEFCEEKVRDAEAYAKKKADEKGKPELFNPWSPPRVLVVGRTISTPRLTRLSPVCEKGPGGGGMRCRDGVAQHHIPRARMGESARVRLR